MKKLSCLVFFALMGFGSMAQVKFEPGYIITTDGQRTECEIRNMDWESNPTSFQYRVAGGAAQEGNLESITEFGITGDATFHRFTVLIDRSSERTQNLTRDRNPSFKQETIYLRMLSGGKATLYEYRDEGLTRFFYAMDGGAPNQLVYKRYLQMDPSGLYETGFATTSDQYKQQLFNDLKCASMGEQDMKKLKYERAPLMKVFAKYNECTGTAVTSAEPTKRTAPTHLTLRPGLFYNSFYIDDGTKRTEFNSAVAFRLGFEIEAVLPFNKGMWSVTFEPAYQSYSSKADGTNLSINYAALDLNVSLRRYLFIHDADRLYVNAGFAYAFPLGGTGALKMGNVSLDVSTATNFTAGIGYARGKFSAEFNYAMPRGLLGNYVIYSSAYGGPGLILGYRFR